MLKKKFFIAISIVLSIMLLTTISYAAEEGDKNWFQELISFEWLTNMFGNNKEAIPPYETVDYNLGLTEYRPEADSKNYSYKITPGKVIWKVAQYPTSGAISGQTPSYEKSIYCVRAEHGFFDAANNGNLPTETRKYDVAFNLKTQKDDIKAYYNNDTSGVLKVLEDGTYNKVLWILDSMYIKEVSSDEAKANLLKSASEYYFDKYAEDNQLVISNDFTEHKSKTCADYLNDSDIDSVQQLALWYYTNAENTIYHHATYNPEEPDIALKSLADVTITPEGEEGTNDLGKRYYAMRALYEYLIDNAKADYISSTETVAPVELDKTRTLTKSRYNGNTIIGPYYFNKKSDLEYTLNLELYDQDGTKVEEYKIVGDGGVELTEVPEGEVFWIQIEDENDEISGLELNVKAEYVITTVKFLTSSNNTLDEQPLVVVEKEEKAYNDSLEFIEKKGFDLALRKYITKVERNGKDVEISSRVPDIDITNLKSGTATTATYKHKKDPVIVETGDIVTYTMRVYNEGSIDGHVTEIKDLLPEGVEFYPEGLTEEKSNDLNIKVWSKTINDGTIPGTSHTTTYEFNETTRELKIRRVYQQGSSIVDPETGNAVEFEAEDRLFKLPAFTGDTTQVSTTSPFTGVGYENGLSYGELQIKCKVTKEVSEGEEVLTNVARITYYGPVDGDAEDRDSDWGKSPNPSQNDLPAYKGKDENKEDLSDKAYHYEGKEDDDDFEKLIVQGQAFDLSLRKFITAINEEKVTDRIPDVDVSKLNKVDSENGKQITTAVYNHPKNPLKVKVGDVVTYTIRVYNEGDVAGYAEEVTDHLPAWLEFIYDDELNTSYGWVLDEADKTLRTVKTNHLSKASDKDNLIDAFNGQKLDYKELKIKCKVKDTAEFNVPITNIADITDFADKDGNYITDRDSSKNNVKLPEEENWPVYRDDKIEAGDKYIPGHEDDDDFEKVIIQDFDLALRKFIVKVNDKELKENDKLLREPIVDATKLNKIDEETKVAITTAVYNHPKDPVEVANNDIVIYTLRIYNEGSMSGYAEEIVDDVPEGLEYLKDHEINKEYEWEVSEDGTKITTEYLSKDNESEDRDNLIEAFDKNTMASPEYKDIQIAFKVIEPNTSDRILVNTAEITKDADENGKDVEDRDSVPGNNNEWNAEDDLDKEFLKVKYFDLALRKWVTRVILIENGGTPVTRETGHTAEMDPEPIVKVDLHRKKINSMTVKFVYMIKVTNQGEIAGYAKELTDYIPTGLKFEQADNPMWKEKSSGVITTRAIENSLLEPGESAEVEVILTWINDGDNMGVKTNIAEISEDYNDSNSPDIDSTPNNKKNGEDDIDDAPVMLSIQPGSTKTYVALIGTILVVIAAGVLAIKKFVLI